MSTQVTEPCAQSRALMEDVLRDGRPLAAEYPLVFQPQFVGRVLSIEGDATETPVLSTCAVLSRRLVTPTHSFEAGLVGSVATAVEHRGQGHGSEVLRRAEAELSADGAVCALLWADDSEWYAARGWVPFGTEMVYVVQKDSEALFPETDGVREATSADIAAIHRLYGESNVRVDRTVEEATALFETPNVNTLVVERDGAVVAYACMGRGEDLENAVHEWAGDCEDVLGLVRAHLARRPEGVDSIYVMVPETAVELLAFFEFTRTPGARGILCMAKITSLEATAQLLSDASPSTVTCTVLDEEARTFRMSGPNGNTVDFDAQQALLMIAPPRSDRAVVEAAEQGLGIELPMLPLQPYVWGLDSI